MSPNVPPRSGIRSVEDDDNMCIVIVEVFDILHIPRVAVISMDHIDFWFMGDLDCGRRW